MKTTIESTKERISEEKVPDGHTKVLQVSIANGKSNILGLTSTILKTDGSVKRAKSIQTLEMLIVKLSFVNMMNTQIRCSLITKIHQSI